MSWNSISVFSRVWFNIKDFNCKIVSQGSAVSKSGIFWLLWFLGDFSNIFSCSSSVFVIGSNYASKSSTFPGKTSQTLLRLTAFAFWRRFFDILAAVFPFLLSIFWFLFFVFIFFKRSSHFRQLGFKRALGVTLLNMKPQPMF